MDMTVLACVSAAVAVAISVRGRTATHPTVTPLPSRNSWVTLGHSVLPALALTFS